MSLNLSTKASVRFQRNGKDAQRMWLVPSASFIVRKTVDGETVYEPSAVSCRVVKQVGSDAATDAPVGEYTLKYRRNATGTETSVSAGSNVTVHPSGAADTFTVDFSLRNAQGVEVDRFTARVIDAGANGLSPDYMVYAFKEFAKDNPPSQAPVSGSDVLPQGWSATCSGRTAGCDWWMSCGIVKGGQTKPDSWSVPVQVTGEDGLPGDRQSFRFKKNTDPYNAPAFNQSQVDSSHGWKDAPPALSAGEYCWMTFANFNGDGSIQGTWSTPIRITPLPSVDTVLELSCDAVLITPATDGSPAFATPSTVEARVWKVENGERTDITEEAVSGGRLYYMIWRQGVSMGRANPYTSAVTVPSDTGRLMFQLYKDSNTLTSNVVASKEIPVTVLVPGPQGPAGDSPEALQGEAAVTKWMELVPSTVTRNLDGTYSPSSAVCRCYWREGSGQAHEDEGVEVGIYLPTDINFENEVDVTDSGGTFSVASVMPSGQRVSSMIFRHPDYGTASLNVQYLVKAGVVRCRKWEDVGETINVGLNRLKRYDCQDGNDTEYLDVVKTASGDIYRCVKSFSRTTNATASLGAPYTPGSEGSEQHWELASNGGFAAFDLLLTNKAKIRNLYVDEVVIPQLDRYDNVVDGKYAMVANNRGIHMTGTITAQAMSLAVDTPANGSLLTAPLNVVDAATTANVSGGMMTFFLPCLQEGSTRQIDVLVVGADTDAKYGYKLTLAGTYVSDVEIARPMLNGAQDTESNAVVFGGKKAGTILGAGSYPSVSVFGLYRCIGYRLRGSNDTWWECIRLNDGTNALSGFSGATVPRHESSDSAREQDTPMDEGQFVGGNTITNVINSLN